MYMDKRYRNQTSKAVACVFFGFFCYCSCYAGPNELQNIVQTNIANVGIELMNLGLWPTVVRVYSNSPAAAVGLKPGDRICTIVDGKNTFDARAQDVSVIEDSLCGPEGTTVTLTVTERTQFPFAEPRCRKLRRQRIMPNEDSTALDPYEPFKEYFIRHAADGILNQVPEFAIINGRFGAPIDPVVSYTRDSVDLSVLVPVGKGRNRLLEVCVRKAVPRGNMSMLIRFCEKGDGGLLNYGEPRIHMEVPMRYFGTIVTNGIAEGVKTKFINAVEKNKWVPLPRIGGGSAIVGMPSRPIMLEYEEGQGDSP